MPQPLNGHPTGCAVWLPGCLDHRRRCSCSACALDASVIWPQKLTDQCDGETQQAAAFLTALGKNARAAGKGADNGYPGCAWM